MSDLVDRLRSKFEISMGAALDDRMLREEAADALEAKDARIAELEAKNEELSNAAMDTVHVALAAESAKDAEIDRLQSCCTHRDQRIEELNRFCNYKDVDIERLTGSILNAYYEGWQDALLSRRSPHSMCRPSDVDMAWDNSDAKRWLDEALNND